MTERINIRIFSAVNKYAGESTLLDNMAIVVAEYLPYVFAAVLIYLWFSSKIDGKNSALFAGCSAVVGVLINRFITFFYFHPRPFLENIGTPLIYDVRASSFPSDHTTFMLSIAAMLLFIRSTRKIGCILFFLGLLGGASRVFCGVHFPQDIFGSLLVSLVTTSTIWALLKKKLRVINEVIVNVYFRTLSRKTVSHTDDKQLPTKETNKAHLISPINGFRIILPMEGLKSKLQMELEEIMALVPFIREFEGN